MKSIRPIARYVTLTTLAFAALPLPAQAAAAVGQAAPAFELLDLDGKTVSLAAFRGKTVVLEWINPNCPVSRDYAERKVMSITAAAHPAVVWLAVNSTNRTHGDFVAPAAHKAYNQKNGIAYPVLYDSAGDTGRAYGAKTTPHMFVIDAGGKVVYNGAIDSRSETANVNYVDAALTALAAGKSPDPSTTKPVGCSVKY
jgi:peroxiredoxin